MQLQSDLRSAELVPGLSWPEFFTFSIKTFRVKRFLPRILHGSITLLQGSRSSPISPWALVPAMLLTQPSALPVPKGLLGVGSGAGSGPAQTFSPQRRASVFANSFSAIRWPVLACPQGLQEAIDDGPRVREDEHRHCVDEEVSEGIVLHEQHPDVNNAEDFWHLTEQHKKSCSVCPFPILLQSPDTTMQTMSNVSSPDNFSRCSPKHHPSSLQ